MNMLDLFEKQMEALLTELQGLRAENEKLRAGAASGIATLTETNNTLRQTLEEEQHMKDAVLKRVDGWLARLQDITAR